MKHWTELHFRSMQTKNMFRQSDSGLLLAVWWLLHSVILIVQEQHYVARIY
jgi:hypothetical protein